MQSVKITIVMFLWAICFPLIVLGLPYAPHMTFAAMRAFLAGIVLLVPALVMKRPQPRDMRTWAALGAIGLGATTLGFLGMFHASEFLAPGVATVIANTQPLMAAVLAALFLREYLDGRGKAGLLLGFMGVVLIALPSFLSETDGQYGRGISYVMLAALGITVSNVLIRYMKGRIDALSAMGWQMIFGSLCLVAIALMTEDVMAINWSWSFLVSLVGLALPGTALAYWLWYRILGDVALNRANAFSFLVPVFGLTMGVIFYQESFEGLTATGVGLTIVGIVLVNWRKPATE